MTCKTASAPPRTFLKIESSNVNTMFLTTSSSKLTKNFLKFCLYNEKNDFEGGPRWPKKAKSVLLQEME